MPSPAALRFLERLVAILAALLCVLDQAFEAQPDQPLRRKVLRLLLSRMLDRLTAQLEANRPIPAEPALASPAHPATPETRRVPSRQVAPGSRRPDPRPGREPSTLRDRSTHAQLVTVT